MASSPATQLTQLAEALAGEFDNQAQSLAEPIWYLHLRVWNRPLPRTLFGQGYAFFIEQISVASGNPPYRQRILHLTCEAETLWGQYYGLQDPGHWQGSATQPERLTQLTQQDLISLPTCTLHIDYAPATGQYCARPPADSLCCITYQGQNSYIRLGFDLGPGSALPDRGVELKVYDRGIDPATGKTTWGPLMGPFHLVRQQAYEISPI
ncbi:MAG TPA: chromophore lyase CpcT/CpeT [Leptolyngbyaceae cyanobacterium M65_K2018_010]|nr:chromophore lyase CpcT/CpeT [Leptolyngbyaceae cyanobacterium M65_K2018_010]